MLHVVTFKWNSAGYRVKYQPEHVNVLEAMVKRHYHGELRFLCVTDDPAGVSGETAPLWSDCAGLANASGRQLPSCYRRLKLFDPETQRDLGMRPGDRLVSLDLDTVCLGNLNALWDRDDEFIGWALPGTHHRRVFNGSMWLLRFGGEAHVWREFDPETSPSEAKAAQFLGSDQSWISYRLQGRPGWTEADGVYSFPQSLRSALEVPEAARVVMFHGFRKPWMPGMPEWVRNHYRRAGRGRCLVLGHGATVWDDAERALASGSFDGVIASPEAAEQWPGPVAAVAACDSEALSLVRMLGFDSHVLCGQSGA